MFEPFTFYSAVIFCYVWDLPRRSLYRFGKSAFISIFIPILPIKLLLNNNLFKFFWLQFLNTFIARLVNPHSSKYIHIKNLNTIQQIYLNYYLINSITHHLQYYYYLDLVFVMMGIFLVIYLSHFLLFYSHLYYDHIYIILKYITQINLSLLIF